LTSQDSYILVNDIVLVDQPFKMHQIALSRPQNTGVIQAKRLVPAATILFSVLSLFMKLFRVHNQTSLAATNRFPNQENVLFSYVCVCLLHFFNTNRQNAKIQRIKMVKLGKYQD
jgi:hypothetical protein